MIQVNIKDLTATRVVLPYNLRGLSKADLNNLQTALNPVPSEFKNIEFWDEVDETPPYDTTTQAFDGTETLTCNAKTKKVKVVRGIRAKTQEEFDAEYAPLEALYMQAMQSLLDTTAQKTRWDNMQSARDVAGLPLLGDESDVEVAMHTEAVKLARWYLKVRAYGYQQLDAIQAGEREMPTSVDALIEELPVLS